MLRTSIKGCKGSPRTKRAAAAFNSNEFIDARHAMLAVGYTPEEASIKNKRRAIRLYADRMKTSSGSTNLNDHTSSTSVAVTNITPSKTHAEKKNSTNKRKHDIITQKWRKTSAMVVLDSASKLEQKRVKNKALKDVCMMWKERKDKEGGLVSGNISEMTSEKYEITISAGTVWRKVIECTDEDYQ
eukprot:5661886-Ditylum_brightwellii.AAC.1